MRQIHSATTTRTDSPVKPGRTKNAKSPVAQTALDAPAAYEPKTELGKKLWAIRREIVASGLPLLDEAGIRRELAERRGGVDWSE